MKYNYKIAMEKYKREYAKIFSRDGLTEKIAMKFFPLMILRPVEVHQLFCYAKKIPKGGTYLEIGSWFGASLICVNEAAKLMGKSISLISIESKIQPELLQNTKSFSNFRLIKGLSDLVIDKLEDNSVDLIFLDSARSYEPVGRDILNSWPKIKIGGILLGHDYVKDSRFDVKRAADKIFGEVLIKPERPSRIFRIEKTREREQLSIPLSHFKEKELRCDIITPTYNRPNFLKRAIRSVLNQTSPFWELWIYDDGSDYDVEAIIKKFDDSRIHFIKGPKLVEKERNNHSSSIPRNALLTQSNNEIIIYLDDDNYLWPDGIATILEYFKKHSNRDVIYCKLTYSNAQTDKLPKEKRLFRMFKHGHLDTGQIVHRRKCLDWTFKRWNAYWPPGAKVCNDFHFFTQLKLKYRFYPLDDFVMNKYEHQFMHQKLAHQGKRGSRRRE